MRILYLLVIYFVGFACYAQPPATVNYQGIARNTQGAPLAGSTIAVRLSIKDAVSGGNTLYSETKSVTTNAFGLYTISINDGTGTRSGDFNSIDWSSGQRYIQTEIDPANGSAFSDMGTQVMQSVPFALQAMKARTLNGAENPQNGDILEYQNGNWTSKPKTKRYNVSGLGSDPNAVLNFLSPPVIITIEKNNPIITVNIAKSFGSNEVGGATGLALNIGYQKVGENISEFDTQHRMISLRIAAGVRLPIPISGSYQTNFQAGETYIIGLVGYTYNPGKWSNNGIANGYVEVSY